MHNELFNLISKYITLDQNEKAALESLNLIRSFRKGSIFQKEGQKSFDSYFVLKGCKRTYYILEGKEQTKAFYTESEAFTPPCVLQNTASEFYVRCVKDSILRISDAQMKEEINQRFPQFDAMCRVFSAELLAKKNIDFDPFKTSSPEKRHLNLVENRPDLIQSIPRHQIASYQDIKPQSLSR
ncbi:Crp/Fnr family transcriptional regulator [Leadbetterella byssophila]|uniref:Crp/Fnr family transcriptional regulator n=1 Tax=Leadbetterella byssophila TaxID=316068 RepID=UPI00399FA545